jgi:osmotically-inducible protein OsmY
MQRSQPEERFRSDHGRHYGDRYGLPVHHQGKAPKGYQRSAEAITEDLCSALHFHPLVDASDVKVAVEGEHVILSGSVANRDQKWLCDDLAYATSGVKEVDNRILVKNRKLS